jgi:hypothetical protein
LIISPVNTDDALVHLHKFKKVVPVLGIYVLCSGMDTVLASNGNASHVIFMNLAVNFGIGQVHIQTSSVPCIHD